jgi:hypothetical protein
VEKSVNVSYRYDKSFNGISIVNNESKSQIFYHFVRDLSKFEHETDLNELEKLAIEKNISQISTLGRGKIVCTSSKGIFELVKNILVKNPSFLIKGK